MSNMTTGKVRFSFVNVFTPRAPQDGQGEAKYSVTLLIPKSDVATIQAIQQAMEAAVQEGISSKFNGQRPPRLNFPLYDGDGVRPSSGEPFGEECRGHMVITASSIQRPEVVDTNLQPIINQAELYSGCYGRASLRFFPYAANGNKGVGCGLGNIQKVADGDPLSGRTSAADDFGGSHSFQANAPAQFTPQQYNAPQQYQQPQYQAQSIPSQYAPAQNYQQPQQNYQDPAWFNQQAPMQFQQQQQINPVTGQPMSPGGVMGI